MADSNTLRCSSNHQVVYCCVLSLCYACICTPSTNSTISRCCSKLLVQPIATADKQCHKLCSTAGHPMAVAMSSKAKKPIPINAELRCSLKLGRR